MLSDDIIIKEAIVHILDSATGQMILSDKAMDCGPDLYEFFRTHLEKITCSDDLKHCKFTDESTIAPILENFQREDFVNVSQNIATSLYEVMAANINILPADLAVLLFRYKEQDYIGLLKMNYKSAYTHYNEAAQEGNLNGITINKSLLPSESQRINEAVVICLSNMDITLLEKKYDINGTKTNYMSQLFLKCHAPLSPKAKINIVSKAVEQVNDKYFSEEDIDRKMEVKKIIHNELQETGALDVAQVKEKVFKDNEEMKQDFQEKLEKYNLAEETIQPQNKATVKKFEKQCIKTDTGIEITIPMDQYGENENVSFFSNPDGTISVVINNIGKLTSR